jgi:hypothetical protein
MSGIFLSYRRDDSSGWAGRLYEHLVREWGSGQVFMDIDAIAPGEDFREAITRTMHACDVVIVVIGPNWVGARGETGSRRLDDMADNHRAEVVAALAADVRVVPVLVGGAAMPKMSELPEPMKDLAFRNAAVLEDRRFASDVDALQRALKQFAESVAARRSADDELTPATVPAPTAPTDEEAARPSDELSGERATVLARRGAPPGWIRRGAGPGGLRWRWLVLTALVVVVGLVAIVILQGGSSTPSGQATLFEDQTSYRSAHGIELSGLRAVGQHDPATVGDRITIEFSLENVGTDSLTFEETFVAARSPDDDYKDFGYDNVDRVFDPGSVVEIRHSIDVDAAGTWRFWPCYSLTTGECPDEWQAFPVEVE